METTATHLFGWHLLMRQKLPTEDYHLLFKLHDQTSSFFARVKKARFAEIIALAPQFEKLATELKLKPNDLDAKTLLT